VKRAYITDYLDNNGRTVLVSRPSVKVSFSGCTKQNVTNPVVQNIL
jgi:hypothetical protein